LRHNGLSRETILPPVEDVLAQLYPFTSCPPGVTVSAGERVNACSAVRSTPARSRKSRDERDGEKGRGEHPAEHHDAYGQMAGCTPGALG